MLLKDFSFFIRRDRIGCVFVSLLLFLSASSCSEEKGEPLSPEPDKGRFEDAPFKWDFVHSTTDKDDIFIGDKYISVDNRYVAVSPNFYVGEAYTEKDFGDSFRNEMTAYKNPIDVIFAFTNPFIGTVEEGTGASGYKKLLAMSLDSEEYKEYIKDKHSPFGVKLVEIYSSADLNKVFPDNNGILGTLLAKELNGGIKMDGIKGKLAGELSSICFMSYMDYPANGFFRDKEKDISPESPVYVRSISYGKAAFFVIESKYSYKEVADAILSKMALNDIKNAEEILKNSAIVLFTVSDSRQTAEVYKSFEDLDAFLDAPFNEASYGYPIFCQVVYTKDNSPYRNANFR